MAKKTRRYTIGSVIKNKDETKPDYIKIGNRDVVLKAGSFINLETPQRQLKSAEEAFKNGKLSEEVYRKIVERLSKTPSWVRFELIQVLDNQD